jgi:1,4-dihydroxy-2-naphthoate octaprenyltransferase
MSAKIKSWLQASRLPSQGYIFCPLLLGQALWFSQSGVFNLPLAGLTWLFGLMIQLYIVYANDLADVEVDRMNTTFTPFSGGSRVLVDGKISVPDLKMAVVITVLLNGLIGLCFFIQGRPLAPWLILISLALLWLYSFPPVRLSYRGGGEFLQMAGVGLILPIFGYYIQGGSLEAFPWRYIAALLPLQLACAFSTTLPDEPSDRAGGKKTIAVMLGTNRAKAVVLALHVLTLFALAGVILPGQGWPVFLSVIAASVAAITGLALSIYRAVPGSRFMLAFVTCSILATLGLTSSIAIERFVSICNVQ